MSTRQSGGVDVTLSCGNQTGAALTTHRRAHENRPPIANASSTHWRSAPCGLAIGAVVAQSESPCPRASGMRLRGSLRHQALLRCVSTREISQPPRVAIATTSGPDGLPQGRQPRAHLPNPSVVHGFWRTWQMMSHPGTFHLMILRGIDALCNCVSRRQCYQVWQC
jgi:hypothetical protein